MNWENKIDAPIDKTKLHKKKKIMEYERKIKVFQKKIKWNEKGGRIYEIKELQNKNESFIL